MYTQALLTMGDDEFFSSSPSVLSSAALAANSATTATTARNPLTLDELTVYSRKLLNIAFALYWREDLSSAQQNVPRLGKVKWENVRETATRCLQALHARE